MAESYSSESIFSPMVRPAQTHPKNKNSIPTVFIAGVITAEIKTFLKSHRTRPLPSSPEGVNETYCGHSKER